MKITKIAFFLVFTFLFNQNVFSQDYPSCPKVLDETIQFYQPPLAKVACEYDVYGKCINSFVKTPLLDKKLSYFDTRFRDNGVELLWKSKHSTINETFKLLRSRDGNQFQEIAELNSADFYDGQITYLDDLPRLGNNHYILKNTANGKTLFSNQQSVYVSAGFCHLETVDVKNKKDQIKFEYLVDNSGSFQLLVTDSEGHEQIRKSVALTKGRNNISLDLPVNGTYFVTITNGFSSLTDLVVQSGGSDHQNTAVSNKNK